MTHEHPLVRLARATIEAYIRDGRVIEPPKPLSAEMQPRRGTFVSLHIGKNLRGCIGTIEPTRRNVAEEIISNAISAATRDPRFNPVTVAELPSLDISVDVLTDPEPIATIDQLDPRVYGVIVESGQHRGLLLPDLDGVDTAQKQVSIALQKAWIDPRSSYRMYRFEVVRYH